MLRTFIALTTVLVPAAAFAADTPIPQILERDGMKFEYTSTAYGSGGMRIVGRELPSAASSWRKSFTLYVSHRGQVTGDYAGSGVDFTVDRNAVAKLFAGDAGTSAQLAVK